MSFPLLARGAGPRTRPKIGAERGGKPEAYVPSYLVTAQDSRRLPWDGKGHLGRAHESLAGPTSRILQANRVPEALGSGVVLHRSRCPNDSAVRELADDVSQVSVGKDEASTNSNVTQVAWLGSNE